MKLKSMKNKGGSDDDSPVVDKDNEYPYGLRISIDDDQLSELNIGTASVGSEVMIMAKAKIVSRSEYKEENNNSNKSMSLQITDMAVHTGGDVTKRSGELYG